MDFNSHISDIINGKNESPIEVPSEVKDALDAPQVSDLAERDHLGDNIKVRDTPMTTIDLDDLLCKKIGKQISFRGRVDLGTVNVSRQGCGCNNACANGGCSSSCISSRSASFPNSTQHVTIK